jgi:phasin family protein
MMARGTGDVSPFLEQFAQLQQRNIEAMTALGQAAVEGVQRLAFRQKEMLDRYMAMAAEESQAFAEARTPEAQAAFQAEFMKRAYTRVVEDLRELSELTQEANTKAMDVLNQRMAGAMDEVTRLTGQTK